MKAFERIDTALSAPKTHRVATTYACGKIVCHDTRNAASAEIFAVGERRKIGRALVSINDDLSHGPAMCAISVEVGAIQ